MSTRPQGRVDICMKGSTMGILGKLFGGGGVTLDSVRKAVQDVRFADAARMAAELDVSVLNTAEREELNRLKTDAGDGLARLNLGEALGMRYSGKEAQAEEYFQLALEKVCSPDLKMEIEAAMAVDGSEPAATIKADAPAGCGGCGSDTRVDIDSLAVPEDRGQQLELILTSYPDSLAERYLEKEQLFQDAFLLAQSGRRKRLWSFGLGFLPQSRMISTFLSSGVCSDGLVSWIRRFDFWIKRWSIIRNCCSRLKP